MKTLKPNKELQKALDLFPKVVKKKEKIAKEKQKIKKKFESVRFQILNKVKG